MKNKILNPEDIYDEFGRFHPSNKIHPTAIIYDNVEIGRNNIIGPYAVIGSDGEIRGVKQFHGRVVIGDGNRISEHVTIQRPEKKGAATVIGNRNMIMAHAHIGHDAKIGDDNEICTTSVIGGYVEIGNGSKIKLHCVVRNRKKIGNGALVGMGAVVVKDVLDGQTVIGNPARLYNKTTE